MNIEMWTGVIAIVLIPTLVLLGARGVVRRTTPIAESGVAGRARRTLDTCFTELGPVVPALVVVLAGISFTVASMWVLGKGAHALQGRIDWPVWRWFGAHQNAGWTDAWWHITSMGSPVVTQRLAVLGAIVFAIVWRKRVWWLPPLAFGLGYVAEKYGQILLKLVVDRGHPPHAALKFGTIAPTLGTWPSGGCARVLIIYGLILYFAIRAYRNGSVRGAWILGAGVLAAALTIQAYARLNDMEHWITDVVGGTIFGVLLLATMIGGAEIVQAGVGRARAARAGRSTRAAVEDVVPLERFDVTAATEAAARG